MEKCYCLSINWYSICRLHWHLFLSHVCNHKYHKYYNFVRLILPNTLLSNKDLFEVRLHNYSLTGVLLVADATLYAHYVFKAFDVNCNGAISFRVSMLAQRFLTLCNEIICCRETQVFQIRDVNPILHILCLNHVSVNAAWMHNSL